MLSANTVNADANFIDEVVALAKSTFVKGYTYNTNFKAQAKTHPELKIKYDLDKHYASIKGEPFSDDRTRIPGTNFIASNGPKNKNLLKNLIEDTVFHAGQQTFQIVALGSVTAYEAYDYQDFFDYCLKERKLECKPYGVEIKHLSGMVTTTVSGHQAFPRGIVDSQLLIKDGAKEACLDVTVFGLADNCSITLGDGAKLPLDMMPHELVSKYYNIPSEEFYNYDEKKQARLVEQCKQMLFDDTKEKLWQLFQKSQDKSILVHCASGVGRTGHFILTMEILKHYDTIFSGNNAQASAARIHARLDNMRDVRPAMVFTEKQFVDAIYNAQAVHQYALKKGYINAAGLEQTNQTLKNAAQVTPISFFQSPREASLQDETKPQRKFNFGG